MFLFEIEYFNKTIHDFHTRLIWNAWRGISLLLSNENTCLSFIATFHLGQKGYILAYFSCFLRTLE